MAHISMDDVPKLAGQLGLTSADISHPVRMGEMIVQCNRCGACCREQNGIILSLIDIYRIAGKLGITPKQFFRHYCRISTDIYDVFGDGPQKGILLTTKNGVCIFYKKEIGCSINDVKPVTCQLYPFNNFTGARICILKMQRAKDGEAFKDCYIFDMPNNTIIVPDFTSLAIHHLQRYVTRDYLAQADDRWQPGLADKAWNECMRLSADLVQIAQYEKMMQAAFNELDHRNEVLLSGIIR